MGKIVVDCIQGYHDFLNIAFIISLNKSTSVFVSDKKKLLGLQLFIKIIGNKYKYMYNYIYWRCRRVLIRILGGTCHRADYKLGLIEATKFKWCPMHHHYFNEQAISFIIKQLPEASQHCSLATGQQQCLFSAQVQLNKIASEFPGRQSKSIGE